MTTFTIKTCPLCQQQHEYYLEVERSTVIKYFRIDDMSFDKELPEPISLTRIFLCPTQNEKFQASLNFFQTSSNKIKSIGNTILKTNDESK
jgi:hypothetical protein